MNEVPAPIAAESLPGWFPAWARHLAELYFSGTTSLFILHGNVHDLLHCPSGAPPPSAELATAEGRCATDDTYVNLPEFLATQVFGSWNIVLQYDLGRGLRALAGRDPARLKSMVQHVTARLGEPASWPRDADGALLALDRFIERNLLEEPEHRKSVAILLEHAQYLAPAGDLGTLARGAATSLVRLLGWSQNPYIKQGNIAFCLVADKLSEMNDRLVQSPHVAAIELPLPDREAREAFAGWKSHRGAALAARAGTSPAQSTAPAGKMPAPQTLTPAVLAELSNGLSLVNLNVLLSQAGRSGRRDVDSARFRELKKTMIERQCQGLVEFVEPRHTLDLVVGQEAAKQRLKEDADFISAGRLGLAPMGYLLCGAVGTGKSFLAECYAGSIGIPCVKLRNFRSKYVGETEGNLEQVLNVLRSLGPVVVIIDEADAALGNRSASGDSGTSSRVFSMIASQMGDTNYRGKIVWMLLTSRPDLLPIDLKRQGRAEVHIPMFYPSDEDEIRNMFLVMARKNKVALSAEMLPAFETDRHLSGADIESIVLSAKRRTERAGQAELQKADLEHAIAEFIPSVQGLEKELQELAAVLECTELSFLPRDWREKVAIPGARAQLQERLVAIRQLVDG